MPFPSGMHAARPAQLRDGFRQRLHTPLAIGPESPIRPWRGPTMPRRARDSAASVLAIFPLAVWSARRVWHSACPPPLDRVYSRLGGYSVVRAILLSVALLIPPPPCFA